MPPYRIEWLDEAQVDVRALDRSTAMRLAWATTASCSRSNKTSCASSASVIALKLIVEQMPFARCRTHPAPFHRSRFTTPAPS